MTCGRTADSGSCAPAVKLPSCSHFHATGIGAVSTDTQNKPPSTSLEGRSFDFDRCVCRLCVLTVVSTPVISGYIPWLFQNLDRLKEFLFASRIPSLCH